jgi:hypothetical protein
MASNGLFVGYVWFIGTMELDSPLLLGSQDCSEPLCGSLGAPERKPRQGDNCECDPG